MCGDPLGEVFFPQKITGLKNKIEEVHSKMPMTATCHILSYRPASNIKRLRIKTLYQIIEALCLFVISSYICQRGHL